MNIKSFLIHAPGNAIAGGCESLHQLGDAINRLGGDASMCYYPHDKSFTKPDKFSRYNIQSSTFKDSLNVVHVFPEIYTKLSQKVSKGTSCIFWLSIDNYYFKKDHFNPFERYKKYYGSLLTARLPIFRMKNMIHLMQSEYAALHFKNKNLKQFYIGDYVYFDELYNDSLIREDKILYNPAKGLHISEKLIENNPDLKFLPLKGYEEGELKNIMRSSKIYIDFGNHPGRDRLPREFVLDGGVLISGLRGSAKNDKDIPLPKRYKLDANKKSFSSNMGDLLRDILNNFQTAQNHMGEYRKIIINDKEKHLEMVKRFISNFKN